MRVLAKLEVPAHVKLSVWEKGRRDREWSQTKIRSYVNFVVFIKNWMEQKVEPYRNNRIRRKIELESLCNVFIWVNLGGIIAQFQSPPLYASLAFPLPERKLIKWLANSHKKRLESDWHHCRWDTHTHTQHYKNCEHVCVCLCVHTVKHFQHLINQLLTWQVDWHVLHLLLLSVSCLTHAHTHICEHTLDIERQWEPLICISWTWHTHTHSLTASLLSYFSSQVICDNDPIQKQWSAMSQCSSQQKSSMYY